MDGPRSLLDGVALANLLVRFGLEMATLVAVGYASFRLAPGLVSGVLMALLAPFALSLVWGAFVSPKARLPLRGPVRLVVEVLVFGAGAVGLWLAGHRQAAVALGTVAILSLGITHGLGDPLTRTTEGGGHG